MLFKKLLIFIDRLLRKYSSILKFSLNSMSSFYYSNILVFQSFLIYQNYGYYLINRFFLSIKLNIKILGYLTLSNIKSKILTNFL